MKSKIATGVLLFVVLIVLTLILFFKGLELKNFEPVTESEVVEIHFLGLEINDQVTTEQLPSYANTFFVLSVATLMVAMYPIWMILQVVLEQFNGNVGENG